MDTRFLESLITVVESGSIAAAARLQGLTAAAISQRIQALEREMDCELLSRAAHTAKPTEACLNLMPRARKLVREAEALKGDIDSSGLSGTLRIGAISTALTGLLPLALRRFTESAPQVKLHITPGTSQILYDALQTETLDAAILVEPPFAVPKKLAVDRLRKEPLLLLSKAADTRSMHEILTTEPYICYDSRSWGGRLAEQYLADKNLYPATLCELDAPEAIQILVMEGMGATLVPSWAGLQLERNQVTVHEIEADRYQRKIVLITPFQTQRPKIIAKLKESLLL
ncbi:MAG: LysR family transcriptional regulator [Thermodesulfobacteriota bacterium]|nr:LysR family transcriptional regulator [Thermodesulfobacteriota bacterium]